MPTASHSAPKRPCRRVLRWNCLRQPWRCYRRRWREMAKYSWYKRRCYLCGDTDKVLWVAGQPAMCLRCEGHHETYNDTPIADQEPEYCPYCGCTELEDGMYDPDDDIDYERAIANGIDPDTADWDEIAPYKFGYDEVYCAECDHALL